MLRVNSINVHYGRFQAIDQASLEVGESELVALIGSNGAGKTTLLMALSGILKISTGTIEFMGTRTEALKPHILVGMGVSHVPQSKELFPFMTVMENLELGAHLTGDSKAKKRRLEKVFADFPVLYQRRKQRAGTLSGGEQQMLAIARALMADPKLLLLDEPTTGLAPIMIDRLATVIMNLHAQGRGILLVEQNAHLALEMTERAYVMESGSIVSSAKSAELLKSDLVRKAYLGL